MSPWGLGRVVGVVSVVVLGSHGSGYKQEAYSLESFLYSEYKKDRLTD